MVLNENTGRFTAGAVVTDHQTMTTANGTVITIGPGVDIRGPHGLTIEDRAGYGGR